MHTAMVFLAGYVIGCCVMMSALYLVDLLGDSDEPQ
jgi:hypothetical protein